MWIIKALRKNLVEVVSKQNQVEHTITKISLKKGLLTMSFEKMLEEIDVKQDLKLPFYHLILKAFDQCEILSLDNNVKSLQLSITTIVDTSLNSDKYEVGAGFRYAEIDDKRFVAEVAIPKKINSLEGLYYLAHEMGHFIKGHLDYFIQGEKKPLKDPFDVELEAEQWAVQFFYDMGLELTKEIKEAIYNNLRKYTKQGEERKAVFNIK